MKKAGVVYKITNTITEKAYIGVTTKDNPYKRINDHFRKSNSKNSIISKSIKKHGKENFKVEILLTCFDLDYLSDMEKFFIEKLNTIQPNGYNITTGGFSNFKHSNQTILKNKLWAKHKRVYKKLGKQSKEHVEKLSKVRKGVDTPARKNARRHWTRRKKLQGDFIEIIAINIQTGEESSYRSIKDCADELGLDPSCVSRVCRGKDGRTQHKGYKFKTKKYGNSSELVETKQTKIPRCDICGKFRKESEVVLQEHSCWDGLEVDQYLECRYCMSPVDEERYFKREYLAEVEE